MLQSFNAKGRNAVKGAENVGAPGAKMEVRVCFGVLRRVLGFGCSHVSST